MYLSVVIPIYNEEWNIPILYSRIIKNIVSIPFLNEYEIIFIDDGSTDFSLQTTISIRENNPHVKILSLRQNYWHQSAMKAGIDYSHGDVIITMDGDLQDPPELLSVLISEYIKWYDVVYAKRKTRKDTYFKRITAYWFYRIYNFFAKFPIPEDVGDFRLMNRGVVEKLKKIRNWRLFIRGTIPTFNIKSSYVTYDRDDRKLGESHYSLKKMIQLTIDAFLLDDQKKWIQKNSEASDFYALWKIYE